MLSAILMFAGPALAIPLGDPLMSLVDTISIGRFSSTLELAALGPNTLIFQFATYLVASLATANTWWALFMRISFPFLLYPDFANSWPLLPCISSLSVIFFPIKYPQQAMYSRALCSPTYLHAVCLTNCKTDIRRSCTSTRLNLHVQI